ncbi:MAG: universal stress protein [Casimicrobiaceae bacterium]
MTTTVMLSSGRPLLIVPMIGAQPVLGDNVLVAWDGGREAARAVADALPLLQRAKRVTVIVVDADGGLRSRGPAAESPLVAWHHRHDVNAEVHRYDAPDIPIGEWLLSRAADGGSDLVVMGGYGYTRRVRELVLGGVTRTMLQSMTVPVLMSH